MPADRRGPIGGERISSPNKAGASDEGQDFVSLRDRVGTVLGSVGWQVMGGASFFVGELNLIAFLPRSQLHGGRPADRKAAIRRAVLVPSG